MLWSIRNIGSWLRQLLSEERELAEKESIQRLELAEQESIQDKRSRSGSSQLASHLPRQWREHHGEDMVPAESGFPSAPSCYCCAARAARWQQGLPRHSMADTLQRRALDGGAWGRDLQRQFPVQTSHGKRSELLWRPALTSIERFERHARLSREWTVATDRGPADEHKQGGAGCWGTMVLAARK